MSSKSFLATGAAAAATAVIGGAATDVDSRWYRRLDLPEWQPPGQVIGWVWTVLYALIAIATGRAWNRPPQAGDAGWPPSWASISASMRRGRGSSSAHTGQRSAAR